MADRDSYQESDGRHPYHWETQTRLCNGSVVILFRLPMVEMRFIGGLIHSFDLHSVQGCLSLVVLSTITFQIFHVQLNPFIICVTEGKNASVK